MFAFNLRYNVAHVYVQNMKVTANISRDVQFSNEDNTLGKVTLFESKKSTNQLFIFIKV
ncbi:unnamed protein product, partial [Rotaria sp. Silwood2]